MKRVILRRAEETAPREVGFLLSDLRSSDVLR